jgi:hypothetical protein
MKFYEQSKQRTMHYDYYTLDEIDLGSIPYSTVNRALKHEIFFRKPKELSHWQIELSQNIYSSVLVRFPDYLPFLYENALDGKSYRVLFQPYSIEILETFEYLFPDVIKRLDKITKNARKLNKGIFLETDLKSI